MNDDIDPGIHRYVNSQGQECNKDGVPIKPIPLPSCRGCGKLNVEGACETCAGKFFIKREDVAPSWKPSFSQHMEDLYMHSYLQKQHKDLEAKCGKDIADMMYGPIAADKCYISGCTCGKSKYRNESGSETMEKKDTSDWGKLNAKVEDIHESVELLTSAVDRLDAEFRSGRQAVNNLVDGTDSTNEAVNDHAGLIDKLVETLDTQLSSIRDLHDTVKTHTGMIERTNETVNGQAGILDKLLETVTSHGRSIERLLNNTADLQKRVKSLEVREATNYLPIKDTGKGTNISVNIPQTTQPTKDNTSKLLLKRFLAVQRICEASIDLDTHGAVAPSSDRQWLAQSVLNILKGNVD